MNTIDANANITVSKVVNSSADKVWEVLRQMDDIDKFSSAVERVEWNGNHGVGGERVCYAPDGQGVFKESILGFDDDQRSYTYGVKEGVPAQGMVNNFKVLDLGYQKSMIVWTSNFEQFVQNPQMTEEQFMGFLNQSIHEMIDNIVKTVIAA
ncbi:MAG TPA: SRPBCC family protein [Microscillaceae bacterium]|nr:SRPBCC family protein [Microscillaceae bacterium]